VSVVSPLARFSTLLDDERKAALSADLESLATLQGHKQRVLAELEAAPPTADEQADVVRKARANVGLLRQLAELHHALLAGESASTGTYGPNGVTRLEGTLSLRRL
jgi:hypothetical protein